jgi:glycosyltransferase involved in cell wall biosynthesis
VRKKILFLVPYPLHEAPSQRFRFEQYFTLLNENNYELTVQSFLDSEHWKVFFKPGKPLAKAKALIRGLSKRCIAIFKSPMYDFVFIHREAAPLGPPIFEWVVAKVFRKKIIYDFDDAIWLTDRTDESFLLKLGKWRRKVGSICKWSHKVSCGNAYLCNYAMLFNKNVVYNPTTIDTSDLHNPNIYSKRKNRTDKIRIGWTGSHSTLKYLHEIEHILAGILKRYSNVEFVVIADKRPSLTMLSSLIFLPWNFESEIRDLMTIDIGVMPLPDDPWAQGKCGFKALQYMALALPSVISPVGVNSIIVADGINGYLCKTPQEWERALIKLIEDPELRERIGMEGRKRVVSAYSVVSNSSNFVSLFE